MFKTFTQTTQLLGASFANHYLITQSPLASCAMLLVPLVKTASRYLRRPPGQVADALIGTRS